MVPVISDSKTADGDHVNWAVEMIKIKLKTEATKNDTIVKDFGFTFLVEKNFIKTLKAV